jgi:DNA-binding XRE family transcriptional regulator
MSLSPAQCRAARPLLDIDQATLARRAVVSRDTVADFEAGIWHPNQNNLAAIRIALELAGVMFLDDDSEGGMGVRLKKPRELHPVLTGHRLSRRA